MTTLGHVVAYAAAGTIGAGIGTGELVSRYRDRPMRALRSLPAAGYIALNAVASALALGLILAFGWTFGAKQSGQDILRVLAAGFGAMALFRSSLFTVRAGDQDISIGPNGLLTVVMSACDRGVDRGRASDRAAEVTAVMKDVSFGRAVISLPTVALALMQNLDATDQAALGVEVDKLSKDTVLDARAKSLLLGLAIANAVGPHVLAQAKSALGEEILEV